MVGVVLHILTFAFELYLGEAHALATADMMIQLSGLTFVLLVDETRWMCIFYLCAALDVVLVVFYAHFLPGSWLRLVNYAFFAVVWFGFTTFFVLRREVCLRQVVRALQPDLERYNQIWETIVNDQSEHLKELAETVARHVQIKARQGTSNLDALFYEARNLNAWYQDYIVAIVDSVNERIQSERPDGPLCIHQRPEGIKKEKRAIEKVRRSYGGDATRLVDLVRSTIVVPDIVAANMVLELTLSKCDVKYIKNRLSAAYDARASGGYRDLNLTLGFQGTAHTSELQIIPTVLFRVKTDEGHARYVAFRNMRSD